MACSGLSENEEAQVACSAAPWARQLHVLMSDAHQKSRPPGSARNTGAACLGLSENGDAQVAHGGAPWAGQLHVLVSDAY